jgi:hypothetical protein
MAFSTHDQVPDSPTNVFATLNNLCAFSTSQTFSDGNLQVAANVAGYPTIPSNIPFPIGFGKWYIEFFIKYTTGYDSYGILPSNYNTNTNNYPGSISGSYGYLGWIGSKRYDGNSSTSYGDTFGSNGNLMGLLFDAENGTLEFFKNGVSQGTAFTSISTTTEYIFGISDYDGSTSGTYVVNFGQDSSFGGNKTSGSANAQDANGIGDFYYTPPTALALCTANLPDPAIDPASDDLPEDYFKCVGYVGGNTNEKFIGFRPDLVWTKKRNGTENHMLYDSVRGVTKRLYSNDSAAESTGGMTSFSSTGFTMSTSYADNESGYNFISWNWRAGGAPSGATSATGSAKRINSSGTQDDTSCDALATAASATITPTLMSINQKSGFSIVRFNGNGTANATVPHGLNKPIEMLLCKQISDSASFVGYAWNSWHIGLSNNSFIALNATDAESSASSIWVTSGMTNQVFTHGTAHTVMNRGTGDYIAYCFTSIEGYSAFGSYTGNGDGSSTTDGPFVYTGFKPAFLIIKQSSSAGNSWWLTDSTRSSFNGDTPNALRTNEPDAENTANSLIMPDYLSNGFKIRGWDSAVNTSGSTYIYIAFASMPQKFSVAR